MNIDKVVSAIQADSGIEIEGLKESLTEMQEGKIARTYSDNQLLIRTARGKTGLSQKDFAKSINTPVSTLRDWEQGRYPSSGAVNCLMHLIVNKPELINELAV